MINKNSKSSKSKARIPQQSRGIETKKQIIAAALKLFSEKGYHGTNTKEIASAAGVSTGSYYAYFKDKKNVFMTVMEDYKNSIFDKLFAANENIHFYTKNKKQYILNIIQIILDAHDHCPEFHQEIHSLTYSDPDVRTFQCRKDEMAVEQTLRLFECWKEHLRIKDYHSAAILVTHVMEEACHVVKFSDHPVDEKKIVNAFADMLSRYLFKD